MTQNKKNLGTKPLTNDQLIGVTGGEEVEIHPLSRFVKAF